MKTNEHAVPASANKVAEMRILTDQEILDVSGGASQELKGVAFCYAGFLNMFLPGVGTALAVATTYA